MKLYKIMVKSYTGTDSHIWIKPHELEGWVKNNGATLLDCYNSETDEAGKVIIQLEAHISELKKELEHNESMLREVNDERNY